MGEGHLQKFERGAQFRIFGWVGLLGLSLLVVVWGLNTFTELSFMLILLCGSLLWLIVAILLAVVLGGMLTKPTRYIAQAILHISPSEHLTAPPNIQTVGPGRELVESLARQVYDYASVAKNSEPQDTSLPKAVFDQMPLPVICLDQTNAIVLANSKAVATIGKEITSGQQLHDTAQLLSNDEVSVEAWIENSRQNSLTDTKSWQKMELKTLDGTSAGYFDVVASFNNHSASGIETVLIFADHSDVYESEVNDLSFIALAVHEMRNPVTILRGYIEAFQDELGPDASPQISDDLRKMNASAENLMRFVSNILNVARINQNELVLNLHEDNWNTVLPQVVDSLRNRASVYGKTIELRMQPEMPTVAVDRMTVGEVVTNLIDNAIKYSPDGAQKITVISQVNRDGLIETTVHDTGVGIPGSVMPDLFTKFRRNHRNQGEIGGTGLGLFLCKAIVTAHRGNIWVNSKEGKGSTFGFTLLPYTQLAKDQQLTNNESIVRSSHGWIKNHSMQRR